MEIFNIHVFGEDAQAFNELTIEQKITWIKKYTNQQNDELICEFLNNPSINKNTSNCFDCGKLDNKIVRNGDNISKTNAVESSAVDTSKVAGNGKRGVNKGRNNSKTS